jgi:phosphoglycerol transferase
MDGNAAGRLLTHLARMADPCDPKSQHPPHAPFLAFVRQLARHADYPIAMLLCLAVMTWALKLGRADLTVPFTYANDAMYVLPLIKGELDNGWYLTNDRLGAPGCSNIRDYPITDVLPLALVRILGTYFANPFTVYNLFYLLTYPLTVMTALVVLRHCAVPPVAAVAGSLLYAFLPYHHLRMAFGHFFLGAYFLVPLMVLVLLWICQGRPLLFRFNPRTGRYRPHLTAVPAAVSLLVCLLTAAANAYYAFFACFLLLIAGFYALLRRGCIHAALSAGVLLVVISAGVAAAGLPTLLYQYRNGTNPEPCMRPAEEADLLGLRISHLLLPAPQHRCRALANLRAAFSNPKRPAEHPDGNCAALGLVGSAGFLILLGCLLVRSTNLPPLLNGLRILNVFAVLLGTIGGFGSLFNFLVYSQIRCYNRISIYVGFFALLAVAWLVGRAFLAPSRPRWLKGLGCLVVGLGTVAGLWDQTTASATPDYEQLSRAFHADAEFVQRIEAALPAEAMVFQLPYTRFPEWTCRGQMGEYVHFRGYLHSHTLRWSYGAMVNRETDAWQKQVASLPPSEMVKALALAGFRGIYVDRLGYPDQSRGLEAELTTLLNSAPLVSADNLRSFFGLPGYERRLRERYSSSQWEEAREKHVLFPCALYQNGFFAVEPGQDNPAHWCQRRGQLALINPSPRPKLVQLSLACRTEGAEGFPLCLKSGLFSYLGLIDARSQPLTFRFQLPPGRHVVRLRAQPSSSFVAAYPGHVFYVADLSLREVEQ